MAIVENLLVKMSARERLLIWLSCLVLFSGLGIHFYTRYEKETAWYQEKINEYRQRKTSTKLEAKTLSPKYDYGVVYQFSQTALLEIVKIQKIYDQISMIDMQLSRTFRQGNTSAASVVEHQVILSLSGDRTQLSDFLENFDNFYPFSQMQSAKFLNTDNYQLLVIDFIRIDSVEEKS